MSQNPQDKGPLCQDYFLLLGIDTLVTKVSTSNLSGVDYSYGYILVLAFV